MAVSGEFRVDVRPYSGYEDPSLPIAAWIAQGGLAGDASGGNILFDFIFQSTDGPQISELFNLKQISTDVSSSAANRDWTMVTVGMDALAPNRQASPQSFQSFMSAGSPGTASTELQPGSILPIWLGAPNRDEGIGGLRFTTNNVNLLLYAITIQGYMWGPRSVLAQGGPRRPVGGLFGP